MGAIAESQRISWLRQLGASEPLIRLSCGDLIHALFRDVCLGPPYYVYHGADTPLGPPLAPLWDHGDSVFGVWERADGPEFISYSIEAVAEFAALARSEQGFWATRFDFLYECDEPLEDLRDAASAVGYRFLDRHLSAREVAEGRFRLFGGHEAWLRGLVADLDRELVDPA